MVFFHTGVFSKPLATRHIDFLESLISYTFTGLWLLPMFVICTPINNIWFKVHKCALFVSASSMFYLNCFQEIAIEAGGHILEQKRSSRRRLG